MKAFEAPPQVICGECGRFMYHETNFWADKKHKIVCLTEGCKNNDIPFILPARELTLEVATDG